MSRLKNLWNAVSGLVGRGADDVARPSSNNVDTLTARRDAADNLLNSRVSREQRTFKDNQRESVEGYLADRRDFIASSTRGNHLDDIQAARSARDSAVRGHVRSHDNAMSKLDDISEKFVNTGHTQNWLVRHPKTLIGAGLLSASALFWGPVNIIDFVASAGGLSQGEMKNVGPTGERSVYEMVAEREKAFDFLKTNLSLGDVKVIGFDDVKADTEGAITWDQFQSIALNEFIQNGVTNSARKDAPGMIENYFKQVYSIPDDKPINEWQSWITKKRVDQLMNNLQSDDAKNLFTRVEDQLRAGGLDIPAGTLTSTDIAARMMFANDIFSGPAKSNDHLIVRGILARQAGITVEDVATIDPAKYMEALAGQQSSQVNMELNRQGAEFRKRGTDYLYGPGGP